MLYTRCDALVITRTHEELGTMEVCNKIAGGGRGKAELFMGCAAVCGGLNVAQACS